MTSFSWKGIYSAWLFECFQTFPEIVEGNYFKEVKVEDTMSRYRMDAKDWWPNEEMESRIMSIHDNGLMGVYWQTVTGHMRTAEMFWDFQHDREKTALIWIAASLLEMIEHRPNDWKRETTRFIKEAYYIVIKEMKERGMWRWNANTKNTLPNGFVRNTNIVKEPNTLNDLIEIISTENIYSFRTWTLVHVRSE